MVRPHNGRVSKIAIKTPRPRQMSQNTNRRPGKESGKETGKKTVRSPQKSDSDNSDGSYIFLYQQNNPPSPPPQRQQPQPQQQGGSNRRRQRAPQRIIPETPAQWQNRRREGAFGNIPLAPFFRLVKEIMERVVRELNLDTTDYKIQSAALAAIRLAAEMYMVNFFEDVNLLAQHAKRVTIKPTDIKILMKLRAHQGDKVALSIPKTFTT